MSTAKRRYRSTTRPSLEYTVESFCFGYKKAAHNQTKKGRPLLCYGVNFVKVTINKGERAGTAKVYQAPEDMESLRLPPTVGLRVVVAYEEKEGKRGRDETASKLHMLNWDNVGSLVNQTAKHQYWLARHSLLNMQLRERSREIFTNAADLVRTAWNSFMSIIK